MPLVRIVLLQLFFCVAGVLLCITGPAAGADEPADTPETIVKNLHAADELLFTQDEAYNGRIVEDDNKKIVLLDSEGRRVEVNKSDIQKRKEGLSAMPENVTELLTPREIRDLVTFMAGLKQQPKNASAKK